MHACRTILVLGLAACASTSRRAPAAPPAEADRYAVYSVALSKLFPPSRLQHLIVQAHTVDLAALSPRERGRLGLITVASDETWAAYQDANRTAQSVGAYFQVPQPVTLVDSASALGVRPGEPHTEVIWLSAVGFNAAHTEALVAAVLYCGPLCGDGELLVLARTRNEWHVQASLAGIEF